MVKKRRIHAENVPLQDNRTSLALQLLQRELGGFSQRTATTAAAERRSRRGTKQQLLESTLHLIDLQASTPGFFIFVFVVATSACRAAKRSCMVKNSSCGKAERWAEYSSAGTEPNEALHLRDFIDLQATNIALMPL